MRLFTQLYLTFVGIIVLIVATVGCLAVTFRDPKRVEEAAEWAELWVADLPEDRDRLDERLRTLSNLLDGDVALFSPAGQLVGGADDVPSGEAGPFWDGGARGYRLALADGRTLAVHHRPSPGRHLRFLFLLGLMGLLVAIGCWPVARRLSRRLERLRDGAERWGEGDLKARVPVHGSDEVAQVGRAFNLAADKVQALVESQRRVLANASHELRSPMARLRVALEMLEPSPLVTGAVREVEELDLIVGDVLRSARMDSLAGPQEPVPIELLALLGDIEGDDLQVSGEPVTILGDPRLLRHLVQNLVDNARRYGRAPIQLQTTATGLAVQDDGDALPEAERDQVFEPFFRRDGHAEGVHGGVGLGLALVRQIAQFHGGEVRYVSAEGKSRFEVELR